MDENFDDKKNHSVKISLIGDSGVGKTSIIDRFTKGIFNEKVQLTVGIGYSQKFLSIKETIVECNLWDSAGTERYRAIGKECYRDAFIVCLVYDITKYETYESLEKYWFPSLQENGEKCVILGIIGNKSDLYEDEKVDEFIAREFAEKIDASFFLTSARSGDNIDCVFESLVRKYLDPEFISKVSTLKEEKGENIDLNSSGTVNDNDKKKCCLFN